MPGMSGFGVTLSGGTTTTISEIVGVRAPACEASDIDTTDMLATNGWKTFIAGLKETGELTVDLIYERANYNKLLTNFGGANEQWTITLADTWKFKVSGFIKAIGEITIDMDDKMTHSLTIKCSGKPTLTAT